MQRVPKIYWGYNKWVIKLAWIMTKLLTFRPLLFPFDTLGRQLDRNYSPEQSLPSASVHLFHMDKDPCCSLQFHIKQRTLVAIISRGHLNPPLYHSKWPPDHSFLHQVMQSKGPQALPYLIKLLFYCWSTRFFHLILEWSLVFFFKNSIIVMCYK